MTHSTMYTAMAAILVAFSPMAAQAQESGAAPAAAVFSDAQKAALDTMIHDYLMENPRVIMDSVEQYRQNQEEMDAKAFSVKIKEKHDAIYKDPTSPVVGDKNGDVTLVEFFDYNCGYCKQAFKDIEKLVEEDKKLRIVFKEIPILSETSHTAARYALAADKQGKYWEYHKALMSGGGQINDAKLESVAKDIGLDVEKLKKDADSAEVRTTIEKNLELAREIGISGTPGFIIGDEALRGHYGLEALRKSIAALRTPKSE